MAGRWRAWLPRRRSAPPAPVEADPFTPPADFEPPPEDDPLSLLLAEIQAGALAVYDRHGLPTRLGHYVRDPADGEWRFLAERLSPTRRFEPMLEHPPEEGWRFARLEDLGARSNKPDLAAASDLLRLAARLREARDGPLLAEDLLTAMELGATWRANREIILAARVAAAGARPKTPPRPRKRRSGADAGRSSG